MFYSIFQSSSLEIIQNGVMNMELNECDNTKWEMNLQLTRILLGSVDFWIFYVYETGVFLSLFLIIHMAKLAFKWVFKFFHRVVSIFLFFT